MTNISMMGDAILLVNYGTMSSRLVLHFTVERIFLIGNDAVEAPNVDYKANYGAVEVGGK